MFREEEHKHQGDHRTGVLMPAIVQFELDGSAVTMLPADIDCNRFRLLKFMVIGDQEKRGHWKHGRRQQLQLRRRPNYREGPFKPKTPTDAPAPLGADTLKSYQELMDSLTRAEKELANYSSPGQDHAQPSIIVSVPQFLADLPVIVVKDQKGTSLSVSVGRSQISKTSESLGEASVVPSPTTESAHTLVAASEAYQWPGRSAPQEFTPYPRFDFLKSPVDLNRFRYFSPNGF